MRVAIVGLGLIGGSMALGLRNKDYAHELIGVDSNPHHAEKALELNLVDRIASMEAALPDADLVVVATPVNTIVQLLPKILDGIEKHQIVLDVGSTKAQISASVSGHHHRKCFVASHPMAGTEYSGPEAAITGLFEGKCVVICDVEKSDPAVVQEIEKLYRCLGMQIVYHESNDHDIHTAYVSHISHISSMALALTVLEKEKNEKRIFELASGGFSSTVRLAKSNADTWIPIFQHNRDNVLDVLDEHINTISRFRTLLIKKDFDTFYQLIQQANKIKKIIQ